MASVYSRNDHLQSAAMLLERIPEHNCVTATALVGLYSEIGRLAEARVLFSNMPHKDSRHANVVNGEIQEAWKIFSEMARRNVITWTTMIKALTGGSLQARDVFDRMAQRNTLSWNAMLLSYVECGKLSISSSRSRAKSRVLEHHALRIGTWELFVCGDLEQMKIFFDGLPHRDIFVVNTMIAAYGQAGHCAEAKDLFEAMDGRNVVSWNSMITAADGTSFAADVFARMPGRNVR
ncbi:pentatricopeptide repeat-containing protein At2g35030, mitochondrial-like [Selaginella moellendorffii]|uniref:pentatricopeptide repeat-containing protein At2g35030, mitochondrial-like n=1 Tax=Selaginella moellendorffii TaxID=88036 RepID=UPI000D1C9BF1|nr:pentatricopeptide repeat-containing protein At2g35030, mitochondrial-like [Selaginella moellendorffii]|eukprot:XP_024535510.1 pentatricopeptide repeat-containing protein At2g35030, mitochondrial-like [Selaginella moellendorffii]